MLNIWPTSIQKWFAVAVLLFHLRPFKRYRILAHILCLPCSIYFSCQWGLFTNPAELSGSLFICIYWAPFYDVIYHLHNLYDIIGFDLWPLQILWLFFIDDMFLKWTRHEHHIYLIFFIDKFKNMNIIQSSSSKFLLGDFFWEIRSSHLWGCQYNKIKSIQYLQLYLILLCNLFIHGIVCWWQIQTTFKVINSHISLQLSSILNFKTKHFNCNAIIGPL